MDPSCTVFVLKKQLQQLENTIENIETLKFIWKGKLLNNESLVSDIFQKSRISILATGGGNDVIGNSSEKLAKSRIRVVDDLTEAGRAEQATRARLGQKMLLESRSRIGVVDTRKEQYKFHRIETLPMLPDQEIARSILHELANDPAILHCMTRHQWSVGCLAELYPEGKVGESAVCVMGLNQNKGQKILLRIRTDDLKGFRKMLNIRKVLYHELAHNVHSDHDDKFFQLMRQIERECDEYTSNGNTLGGRGHTSGIALDDTYSFSFEGGSGRSGGTTLATTTTAAAVNDSSNRREILAQAAIRRQLPAGLMTSEEQEAEEITLACGCSSGTYSNSSSTTKPKE